MFVEPEGIDVANVECHTDGPPATIWVPVPLSERDHAAVLPELTGTFTTSACALNETTLIPRHVNPTIRLQVLITISPPLYGQAHPTRLA